MLLRSVTKHVKEQNWFAVFIDFFIVVVGVFIGIQVANWNEDRSERSLETKYLERIYLDAERSIKETSFDIDWADDRIRTEKVVLNALQSKQLEPELQDTFDRGLAFFGYATESNRSLLSIKELQSSGKMSIIKDIELRELIGNLEFQFMTREKHSLHLRELRRKQLNEVSAYWKFIKSDFEPKGVTQLEYDFAALANNTEFINRLSHMNMVVQIHRRNQLRDIDDLMVLKDAIAATLGYVPDKLESSLKNYTQDWGKD
ncbi:hypothetical protein [Marinicella litoralis]|uniref:Uncharacterized protein n=1 Tax=Marinicella litoralis TaxID=644220 RepID=A0A4R6XVU7_9GAMM|nr:hypothetical protein [Marinicella litoralis]TDR22344.1 hypothetical protein C8D91_0832 [Marinicella litoralis]